jgi:hypothetical protein
MRLQTNTVASSGVELRTSRTSAGLRKSERVRSREGRGAGKRERKEMAEVIEGREIMNRVRTSEGERE